MKYTIAALFIFLVTSCSTVDITQYASHKPALDLFSYFSGHTRGWGIVQDRSGKLTRQFTVNILGLEDDAGNLVLEENFHWSDGERSTRVWTITREDAHTLSGRAGDVVGTARGIVYGNALNWRYTLELTVDGSTWEVHFDDWMFLQQDGILLNRATMSKFGIRVGEITISFQKQSQLPGE